MMPLALAAIAALSPFTGRNAPPELVKPQVAAARVAACGFDTVRIRFDETLQEDVVDVLGVSSAPKEQLSCVALASLASSYYVIFPAAVEQEYEALYWRLSEERAKADARAWLAKRGLLARLPTFAAGMDVARFARRLERLCGRKAAGTLRPLRGMATFSEGAFGTPTKRGLSRGKLDDETLRCLLNASAVSGFPLVFIGNGPSEQPD